MKEQPMRQVVVGTAPRSRLKECQRGNGDGLAIGETEARQTFCDCKICEASRWLRRQVALKGISIEGQAAVRDLIRDLGGGV